MPVIFGTPRKLRKPQIFRKRAPAMLYPRMIERKYERLWALFAYDMKEIIDADLVPMLDFLSREFSADFQLTRNDDFLGTLTRIILGIKVKFAGRVKELQPQIAAIAGEVDLWNKAQHKKIIKEILGVDILEADRNMNAAVDMWAKQNVALMVNLAEGEATIIEQMVTNAFRNGFASKELATQLADHWVGRDKRATDWVKGFSVPYRARLVATDQIGKLNGQISHMRQTALGVSRYKWRTSMDERVRESHKKLENTIWFWNAADGPQPPEGIPGFPIRCRCYAEPMIEDLLEPEIDE